MAKLDVAEPKHRMSREQKHQLWQTTLVALASVLVVAGCALGMTMAPVRYDLLLGSVIGAGLLLTIVAALVAVPHRVTGPRSVLEIRALEETPTGLRAFALLSRLIALVAMTLLALAGLARLDILSTLVNAEALRRGVYLMTLVLAASLAYVQVGTLRRPMDHAPGPGGRALQALGAAAALVLGAVGAWMALYVDPDAQVALGLRGTDFPFLFMAAQVAIAFSLVGSRALPSLGSLLGSDKRASAHGVSTRGSAVFLPVAIAFVLLFLVVLLFLLFGVGIAGAFSEIANSPILLAALLLLVVAFASSLFGTFRLSRSESRPPPLYKRLVDAKRRRERIIIAVSALGALVLLVPAALLFRGYTLLGFEPEHWVHFLCLGLLVALGPYGFYAASEMHRVRLLEERFPDFLRDVASSHKGGLTLAQSVAVAARGEYGPLSPEVQRMADQLSWNIPFNEALERFGGRVQTPLVQRAVSLILEANRSGGSTTEVLLAAARDAREIKTLEQDRRLNMSMYTVVIYVTFFVFLGVTAVLYSQFVPQLVASQKAAQEVTLAAGSGAITGIAGGGLDLRDFQLFYFMAAVMQGLGDGIVAGMMGSGKAVLGLRHAFIMVLLSYLTFIFLL